MISNINLCILHLGIELDVLYVSNKIKFNRSRKNYNFCVFNYILLPESY